MSESEPKQHAIPHAASKSVSTAGYNGMKTARPLWSRFPNIKPRVLVQASKSELHDAKDRLRKVASTLVDENHQLGKERVTGPRIMEGQTALRGWECSRPLMARTWNEDWRSSDDKTPGKRLVGLLTWFNFFKNYSILTAGVGNGDSRMGPHVKDYFLSVSSRLSLA